MRIDAYIVCKDVPDWAHGRVINVDGKLLLITRSRPRKLWPRWFNKLGRLMGWRWLERTWGLDYYLRQKRRVRA